jgi:hypothetical protein
MHRRSAASDQRLQVVLQPLAGREDCPNALSQLSWRSRIESAGEAALEFCYEALTKNIIAKGQALVRVDPPAAR